MTKYPQKNLHQFGDTRKPPPRTAETHARSDFTKVESVLSRWLPDRCIRKETFHCPACSVELQIDHGDRIECQCGLVMETHGNALTLWRN